jgi:uroporphyrinogen decarboxylase
MNTRLARHILQQSQRIAMPIGVYAGLEMTKATVKDAISNANAQTEAVLALHEYFHTPVMLTAMDLSAEAEAFGCQIHITEEEIPTVLGRLVTSQAEIEKLSLPQVGEKRTQVHLDTASQLIKQKPNYPVLGGCIGHFSLAGRLFGVSELMELTINDEKATLTLIEKAASFLTQYILAFREIGAWGVIMAEPAAGFAFSTLSCKVFYDFFKKIASIVQNNDFSWCTRIAEQKSFTPNPRHNFRGDSLWRSNGFDQCASSSSRTSHHLR